MKTTSLLAVCAALLFAVSASAKTIELPEDDPVAKVNVPDLWKPESTDKGIVIESPDQVATVFFEVTSPKGIEELISENVDWLMKDQKVEIDPKSKEEKDFTSDGIKWSRISWHGKNDEFGPADVGFLMTKAGNRVLAITFWITEKDKEKHAAELEKIFNSVSVRE